MGGYACKGRGRRVDMHRHHYVYISFQIVALIDDSYAVATEQHCCIALVFLNCEGLFWTYGKVHRI